METHLQDRLHRALHSFSVWAIRLNAYQEQLHHKLQTLFVMAV
jgi:hypothetical protein